MRISKGKVILFVILFVVPSMVFSQYYTPVQISTINTNKTAGEGDMYLDTVNNDYYIGLTTGILAKIGDVIDEKIDTIFIAGDSLIIVEGEDTIYVTLNEENGWHEVGGSIGADNINDNIFTQGNVGIGVLNPLNNLHVVPAVGSDAIRIGGLRPSQANDTALLIVDPATGVVRYLDLDSLFVQKEELYFAAEYAGAVFDTINGTAGEHFGYMTSNHSATQNMNHYEWYSPNVTDQYYDVILRLKVPLDFKSWGINTIANQSELSGSISVEVQNVTQLSSITPIVNLSNTGWTYTTLTLDSFATDPGDIINIIITMKSKDSSFSRVGDILLTYNK
jgi:hypothetical protein|tara:strand:- start:389 stop:1393 length:1005 start_codon:yes stop_codon:yes gene_type:complete